MNNKINSSHSYGLLGKTCETRAAVKMFAPFLLLTAGTGGSMTAHSAEMLKHWVYDSTIHVEHSIPRHTDTRSSTEHVANIRDVFSINMSDLAAVLGVTRPTVYAWLEGQEPKAEAVMRIQRLSQSADKIKQANIIRLDRLVHRPIFNGRSLLDILKADENYLEALTTLKAIAKKEVKTRSEPKGSGKYLRSLNDVLGESSVAIYERS